ncbi:MAG: type II secretion system major pseudopilin GspG [Candidatus Riflebacteria bacterium]|nr:type II secretion system major pseudopilin GspG [Candidatus Riflebacteria bacterium]
MKRAVSGGFTLIELLVVLVILGLLAGLILPRMMGRTEDARRQTAELQIKGLENALSMYYADNGFYPTTEQGLKALIEKPTSDPNPKKWKGPYLEKGILPKDPWDNEYVYLSPGIHLKEFDLLSYGKDGVQGGEGEFADIENWNIGKH